MGGSDEGMVREMRLARAVLSAALVVTALVGCTSLVAGTPVKVPGAAKFQATACTEVSSPLASIDPQAPGEPVLRIPQPAGWQRYRQIDSQLVRYAVVNRDLVENSFAPTATVTLESVPGIPDDEQKALDQERAGLITVLGAADLSTTATKLCGHRAERVTYTAPPMGRIPARKAASLDVVATFNGSMYVATVTIQTTNPDNPTYAGDAKTILTGFQMLPPEAR